MSRAHLRFQVDSRLATLLSQEYSSSERALNELVDNAWEPVRLNVKVNSSQLRDVTSSMMHFLNRLFIAR